MMNDIVGIVPIIVTGNKQPIVSLWLTEIKRSEDKFTVT